MHDTLESYSELIYRFKITRFIFPLIQKKKHFPAEPLKILEENKIFKKRLNNKNHLRTEK